QWTIRPYEPKQVAILPGDAGGLIRRHCGCGTGGIVGQWSGRLVSSNCAKIVTGGPGAGRAAMTRAAVICCAAPQERRPPELRPTWKRRLRWGDDWQYNLV